LKVKHRNLSRGLWLWPSVSCLMLLGMVAESREHVQPTEAAPHLARCREAIEAFPRTIETPNGTWTGQDKEMPEPALKLLLPNAILSRLYVNDKSKEAVALLIVNCGNARYLQGHYPPNCYPAQGENEIVEDRQAVVWHLPDMDINGMRYHFAPKSPTDQEHWVYNFFVMPYVPGLTVAHKDLDGKIFPDIDAVYKSGEDYQRGYFGAAEFQLVTGPELTPEERDQAFVDLLSPNENILWTLENRSPGGKPYDK
jgi:hypothetical protein